MLILRLQECVTLKILKMRNRSIKGVKNGQQVQTLLELASIKGGSMSGMTSETEIVEYENSGSGTAN